MVLPRTGVAGLTLLGISALGIALASPAKAQLTVTLSQPNQSYDTSAGGQLLVFSGTIKNNTQDTQSLSATGLRFPYTAAGQPLDNQFGYSSVFGFPSTIPSQFAPGTSFTGAFFDAQLDQTTKPGVYNRSLGPENTPTLPAFFEVQETDATTGKFFDVQTDYSITVTSPAAVPEASTTVSLGLLLALGLGGVVVAAKRKKAAVA